MSCRVLHLYVVSLLHLTPSVLYLTAFYALPPALNVQPVTILRSDDWSVDESAVLTMHRDSYSYLSKYDK